MGIRADFIEKIAVVSCACLCACVFAACSSSSKQSGGSATAQATPWPAPSDPMARTRAAGLVAETAERLQFHVHAHLDVFVDAKPIVVPAGIGIDTTNPRVHTFDDGNGQKSYGGINVPCDQPCISPLHTHDPDGVLHTESATPKENTFGQFLIEWGVALPANTVVYVDGQRFDGDPRTITLSNFKEIAVVIGTPPEKIPNAYPN